MQFVSVCSFALLLSVSWGIESSASAQGLFGRLRARIEARQQPQPPAATQRPPAATQRVPANPRANPQLNPGQPRVLATPGGSAERMSSGDRRSSSVPGPAPMPTFGIDVTPARVGQYQGLRVTGFQAGSQAPQAGLQPGDVIVSIQGQRTQSLEDVSRSLQSSPVGQQGEIQLYRNGRLYRAMVPVIASEQEQGESNPSDSNRNPRSVAKPPIGQSPANQSPAKRVAVNQVSGQPSANGPTLAKPRSSLGLEVRNASPQRGIEVVVAPAGTAGVVGGLKPLDRIVSVEGRLVREIDDLIRELSLTQPGDSMQFGVVRGESMLELDIEMGGPGGKPIRSATEKSITDTDSESETSPNGGGLLGGMGAALGGLFSSEKPKAETRLPSPSRSPSQSISGEMSSARNTNATSGGELLEPDPLALPEDNSPDRKGSADILPAPSPEADPSQSEVERLRAEVKRLQQKLDQQ